MKRITVAGLLILLNNGDYGCGFFSGLPGEVTKVILPTIEKQGELSEKSLCVCGEPPSIALITLDMRPFRDELADYELASIKILSIKTRWAPDPHGTNGPLQILIHNLDKRQNDQGSEECQSESLAMVIRWEEVPPEADLTAEPGYDDQRLIAGVLQGLKTDQLAHVCVSYNYEAEICCEGEVWPVPHGFLHFKPVVEVAFKHK